VSADLDVFIARLNRIKSPNGCKALVQDVDERFRADTIDLGPDDWVGMASAISKWKSTMHDPAPSRVWSVELKSGVRMTMVSEDPIPISQDEALFFARQRYFDEVLTVESLP
jgi:hypothetical protein